LAEVARLELILGFEIAKAVSNNTPRILISRFLSRIRERIEVRVSG